MIDNDEAMVLLLEQERQEEYKQDDIREAELYEAVNGQDLERLFIRLAKAEKRRRQAMKAAKRWDGKNMATCSAKVPKITAARFEKICRQAGHTRHSALKKYIESSISLGKLYFL